MKRALSLFLTLAMALNLVTTGIFASDFSDTQGHWAEDAITRWSGYGVVNGRGDGSFAPNATMTRAEMAQTYVNLLNLTEKADISAFSDVSPDDWYADAIAKCVAAGILNGTSASTVSPTSPVSREQMFVTFGRAMGLTPVASTDSSLSDLDQVSGWAEGMINALLEAGYVSGVGDNALKPLADINRASVMALMDKTVAGYANEPGTTLEMNGESGLVLVAAEDVTVTGTVGDVVIAQGAADGVVTLKDAAVTGTVTLSAAGTQLAVSGSSSVEALVVSDAAQGAEITVAKEAVVNTVTTAAEDTTLSVSGKVETVTVAETADNATVTADKGAAVGTVTTAGANTTVSGTGTVGKVEAAEGSSGAVVTTPGTTVENNGSGSVTTDKGTVDAGQSGTTGGGSSSGGSSSGGSSGGGSASDSTEQAKTALKDAVKNADQYAYDPAYVYSGDFAVTESGDVLTLGGAYSLTQGMDGTAMNDMARFLGALYRGDNGATVKSIVYQGDTYTWANGENAVNLGSNWVKDADAPAADGNTLVSAIVDEYQSKGAISTLTLKGNHSAAISLNLVLAVKVGSALELNAVLASPVQDIQLTASFSSSDQITVARPVTIDGGGFTITSTNAAEDASASAGILVTAGATLKNLTVSGPNNNPSGWDQGEYGIKIYDTAGVILEDVTVTGANAGIQVNSSEVTLAGTITVTGNEFGGIEVCKSSQLEKTGSLDIRSAKLVHADESYSNPVLWVDGNEAGGTVTGAESLYAVAASESKTHYYVKNVIGESILAAGDYTYDDYTYHGRFSVELDGKTVTISGSYTPEQAAADEGKAVMNDMARFLGALHRYDDGATIKAIAFDGVQYTWNAGGGLLGSNWEDEEGTTLVSAVVAKVLGGAQTVELAIEDLTITFTYAVTAEA